MNKFKLKITEFICYNKTLMRIYKMYFKKFLVNLDVYFVQTHGNSFLKSLLKIFKQDSDQYYLMSLTDDVSQFVQTVKQAETFLKKGEVISQAGRVLKRTQKVCSHFGYGNILKIIHFIILLNTAKLQTLAIFKYNYMIVNIVNENSKTINNRQYR